VLKFYFQEISELELQQYLKKVIVRTIKKLTKDIDNIALISVYKELVKKSTNEKWCPQMKNGVCNPSYVPNILTPNNQVDLFSYIIIRINKWKVSSIEPIKFYLNSEPLNTLTYSQFAEHYAVIILE